MELAPSAFNRHANRLGTALGLGTIAWVAFRTYRRIADEPYCDFEAFYYAGQAAGNGGNIYRAGVELYTYPPMLAAFLSPLARLPLRAAAAIWFALAALTTAGCLALVWREYLRRWELPNAANIAPAAIGLALFLWNEQLRWEFEQGQSDWLLLLALVGTLVWMDRRPWLAGLLLGMAINIKYLPLAMALYLTVRGRWRALAWTAVGTIGWALAPAAALGWERNRHFLLVAFAGLAKLFGYQVYEQPGQLFPLRYEYSLSIPSGAARLSDWLGWGSAGIVALVGTALAATAAAIVLIYRSRGVPLFRGRGGARESAPELRGTVAWEWLGVSTLMLTFSPQMHNRHLYMLLPLLLAGTLHALRAATSARRQLAGAAILLGPLAMMFPIGTHCVPNDGTAGWQTFGGGAACVTAMCLALLAAGLRPGLQTTPGAARTGA